MSEELQSWAAQRPLRSGRTSTQSYATGALPDEPKPHHHGLQIPASERPALREPPSQTRSAALQPQNSNHRVTKWKTTTSTTADARRKRKPTELPERMQAEILQQIAEEQQLATRRQSSRAGNAFGADQEQEQGREQDLEDRIYAPEPEDEVGVDVDVNEDSRTDRDADGETDPDADVDGRPNLNPNPNSDAAVVDADSRNDRDADGETDPEADAEFDWEPDHTLWDASAWRNAEIVAEREAERQARK